VGQKIKTPIIQNAKLIPDAQFGFRQKYSTTDQMHRIRNLEGKQICSVHSLMPHRPSTLINHVTVLLLKLKLGDDQEGLLKLVILDRILNRITGVTSGCWWFVVVNAVLISDICQINQQDIIQLQCYK
jgi:hypothetical protein